MSADGSNISSIRWRTARLLVRRLQACDRTEFMRVHEISREHLAPWEPLRPPGLTLEQFFDQQLARAERAAADGTSARMVGLLDDGRGGTPSRIAGFFSLNNIVRGVFLNADAGWSVSVDCIGRGIATEGVSALLDIAFAPPPLGLGLHRVQANIQPPNVRSVRVAEKCGMRREGMALQMIQIAGEWRDHWMYAKLAHEHQPVGAPAAD